MIKNCLNCDYGSTNELNDIVCTNSDSANCCEFMQDDDICQHWQNYDNEFWGEEEMKIDYKMITEQEFKNLMKIYETTKQFTPEQQDCFICEKKYCYIAIDNRTDNMWSEEFYTLGLCVDYFNNEDLDILDKLNELFLLFKKGLHDNT